MSETDKFASSYQSVSLGVGNDNTQVASPSEENVYHRRYKLALLGNVVLFLLLAASLISGNHRTNTVSSGVQMLGGSSCVVYDSGNNEVGYVASGGIIYDQGNHEVGYAASTGLIYDQGNHEVGYATSSGLIYDNGHHEVGYATSSGIIYDNGHYEAGYANCDQSSQRGGAAILLLHL